MKPLVVLSVVAGILLLIMAGMYATLPAHSLPTFFPGYANLGKHHYTHAAAALCLGFVCFAYTWFATGKKSSSK